MLGGLAISHADAWEHNRREQQVFILSRKEDALHDEIEHIQDPDGPNEEHVHSEIMRFLAQDIEVSYSLQCLINICYTALYFTIRKSSGAKERSRSLDRPL